MVSDKSPNFTIDSFLQLRTETAIYETNVIIDEAIFMFNVSETYNTEKLAKNSAGV